LGFAYPRIIRHPKYHQVLAKLNENKNTRAIDLGCCMGTEIRQLLVDGFKQENILGVDIQKEFADIGLHLFNDDPSFKDRFAIVNVLDDESAKNLRLTTFLSKGVDVVYCGAVYHLLCETDTHKFTKRVSEWLKTGGIYIGTSGGSAGSEPISAPTYSQEGKGKQDDDPSWQFLHSVNSFKAMLETYGFTNIDVNIGTHGFSFRNQNNNNFQRPQGDHSNRGHLVWYAEKK